MLSGNEIRKLYLNYFKDKRQKACGGGFVTVSQNYKIYVRSTIQARKRFAFAGSIYTDFKRSYAPKNRRNDVLGFNSSTALSICILLVSPSIVT